MSDHPTYIGFRLSAYGPLVTSLSGLVRSVVRAARNELAMTTLPAATSDHPAGRLPTRHRRTCSRAKPAAIPARLASGIGMFFSRVSV
ncbi:hypothetical protein [Kribbella speibonae]|uniref:hypothetical protein n=1 Tax=Kribbella speibonae TaxID=1572660 RepID=UPI00192D9ED5|nr:hypothetical protein [Kribbella speibonae]